MVLTIVLAAVAVLMIAICIYLSRDFDYWTKQGVPSINPYSPFSKDRGAGLPFGKKFWELLDPVYAKYKPNHRFVGTFQASQPVLVVLDPEMAKMVLTKEFSSFHSRGQPFDEEADPMSANLFNLDGPRWKNLRAKLSPVFTSGKLRQMLPLMTDIGDQLEARVKVLAEEGHGEVEFKELLIRYCTDVIGSVAFGVTCNSLKGGEDEFYTTSREVFSRNWIFIIRFVLVAINPIFVKLLPFKSLFYKTNKFFGKLMKDTVEFREKNKVERNDLVNIMMQLREADRFETDRINHIEFNYNVMAGQAFLFFIAGLDSIANGVGFALHELALNPELQQRAADHVREMVDKHGGMTYEALRDMDLIERIVRESLRLWGPVGILMRKPTDSFKIPDTDVVVDKKTLVWIAAWQMMHDPEYFPDPDRFDPERFTEEAKAQRHPYTYLPFGEGPRFCIAERFAMLEMKLCLATLLSKYVFSVGKKTTIKLNLDPKIFSPTPKEGFWLRVDARS